MLSRKVRGRNQHLYLLKSTVTHAILFSELYLTIPDFLLYKYRNEEVNSAWRCFSDELSIGFSPKFQHYHASLLENVFVSWKPTAYIISSVYSFDIIHLFVQITKTVCR